MKANVGTLDGGLRGAVGSALSVWALLGGPVWAWVGLVPLVTAILRVCPAYSLLGLSTCPLEGR